MKPYLSVSQPDNFTAPFWAEVVGPVASIRQYCAANAPLVTRIGHGGVAQVMDFLPGEPAGWYGIASDNGSLLGWTQAGLWQRVDEPGQPSGNITLELDTYKQQLIAREDGRIILKASCSIGHEVKRGVYRVGEHQIGGTRLQLDNGYDAYGVPWCTTFGDYDVSGAYWHNRFGSSLPGTSVQVTPVLAQWLYSSLGQGSNIQII